MLPVPAGMLEVTTEDGERIIFSPQAWYRIQDTAQAPFAMSARPAI